ncbi:hypothetical protein WME89_05890 [Sorangium sp. So ce321]|uniref:hypothetical protein n=1 Tax=Sorangium sp. So ce321 TaxID=3133300 RepID=UPI003F603308
MAAQPDTSEAASATGLPAGTPVVRDAADNAAGAVGLGTVRSGRAMASVGTSGVILAHTDSWIVEPEMRLHSFCHAVPGLFYLMGMTLTAVGALRWYRDVLGDGERMAAKIRKVDPYEIISDTASTARPDAGHEDHRYSEALPNGAADRGRSLSPCRRDSFEAMTSAENARQMIPMCLEMLNFISDIIYVEAARWVALHPGRGGSRRAARAARAQWSAGDGP